MGMRLMRRIAEHHSTELAAKGKRMASGVDRMLETLQRHAAQSRQQVPTAQAGNRVLRIDVDRGRRIDILRRFFSHGSTLLRQTTSKYTCAPLDTGSGALFYA